MLLFEAAGFISLSVCSPLGLLLDHRRHLDGLRPGAEYGKDFFHRISFKFQVLGGQGITSGNPLQLVAGSS